MVSDGALGVERLGRKKSTVCNLSGDVIPCGLEVGRGSYYCKNPLRILKLKGIPSNFSRRPASGTHLRPPEAKDWLVLRRLLSPATCI